MEMLKQLGVLIEQATNDANQEPPVAQYERILDIINSRVDMPKHTINGVSKRLSLKNKKVLYYCFDLMQYLSYRCQLALFSQISSKEFLLKISGLLMNQELEAGVHTKILQTVRCWEELFRPHEDLLPMFFQFYAGLLRKDFPIQANYISPYRPKDFKIYKKTQNKKKQENKDKPAKPVAQPTKTEKKTFEEIREKLILTNQIIDNANPAEGVKGNEILLEMMEEIKACEKRINQTINENPNESIMELALAVNDDIYITYRRFKDLQKNRKPEIFILTELNSDMRKETEAPKKQEKVEKKPAEKPSLPKDIFDIDNFQEKPKQPVQVKKEVDIFDIACDPIKPEKKEQSLMDLTLESSSVQTQPSNVNIFDLLGNKPEPEPQPQPQLVPQPITLQTNPYASNNGFPQPNTFQSNSGLNFAPNPYQSNNINVTLSNNFQTQNDIKKYDNKTILQRISDITDFSDFLKK